MHQSRIPFLIFLSWSCLNISCSQYRHMRRIPMDPLCIQKFKPVFDHVVYKTSVDVVGKYISGLLIIKRMPDSSSRIVFTNEMGFTFFDFGFGADTGFRVYQIAPAMNKKPLIVTLRKDFELILFRNMDSVSRDALTDSGLIYHAFPQSKGVNYYITDSICGRLVKMQRASDKKPVMEAFLFGNSPGESPDSISIRHLNFNFSIGLKKISAIAPQ
jgi:hypothetical protein